MAGVLGFTRVQYKKPLEKLNIKTKEGLNEKG